MLGAPFSALHAATASQSRAQALEAAGEVNLTAALAPLFARAREGNKRELLRQLQAVESNMEWPRPARERVLHAFALGLSDLDAGVIDPDVFDYLMSVDMRTRVPHDDFPLAGVPLFNIRAAATGSRASWKRDEGWQRSLSVSSQSGHDWVDAYLAEDAMGRQGFLDSMPALPPPLLREAGDRAMRELASRESLTAVATRSAVLLDDAAMLALALSRGAGPALTTAIRNAARSFDPVQGSFLLETAVALAPPQTASLVLAQFGPDLLDHAPSLELIFDLLPHPELGASAALVLARSGRPDILEQLQSIAAGDDLAASGRARLALDAASSLGRAQ
jgi:hypothetical protein